MESTTLTKEQASQFYSNLNPAKQETRLVLLQPAANLEDVIHLRLATVSLLDDPPFEAISYCWGDFKDTTDVFMDGHSFSITVSLHAALRRLRRPDVERVLWADAVCINQTDLEERSGQVKLMGKIYSEATKVNIWLGEHDGPDGADTERAFGLMHDFIAGRFPAKGDKAVTSKVAQFAKIFAKPWFSRLWVIQEAFLSRNADVVCGQHTQPWQTFKRLFSDYTLNHGVLNDQLTIADESGTTDFPSNPTYDNESSRTRLNRLRILFKMGEDQDFWTLPVNHMIIDVCRGLSCHDQKDKVFALMRCAGLEGRLSVDYGRPLVSIFADATLAILNANDLWFTLAFAYTTRPIEDLLLPTWVIDWRTNGDLQNERLLYGDRGHRYSADGAQAISIEKSSNPILGTWQLEVLGVAVDAIAAVATPLPSDSCERIEPNELAQVLQNWRLLLGISDFEFCRVVVGDLVVKTSPCAKGEDRTTTITRTDAAHWSKAASSPFWNRCFLKSTCIPKRIPLDRHSSILTPDWRCLTVFQTASGLPGKGPRTIVAGDVVCILAACSVPYILRPVLNRPKTYRLVGPCYVHGIMDGEAVAERMKASACDNPTGVFEKISIV